MRITSFLCHSILVHFLLTQELGQFSFIGNWGGAVLNSDIYSSTGKQNEVSLAIFFYLLIYKANHKLIFLK